MGILQLLLFPFSLIYGILGWARNKLFDWNVLPVKKFDIPLISIGNLCMGGTGKTPHVEYVVRLLRENYSIATLSRGYKRKTKGFVLANKKSTEEEIGDEPLQYLVKFPKLNVAVDRKRVNGVNKLREQIKDLDVVVLDDAYQHRYIKPGLSILLTDFHYLYKEDFVFPSGTLREFRRGSKRANIIIVTKCPPVLSPLTRRRISELLSIEKGQKLFFSFVKYSNSENISLTKIDQPAKNRYNYIVLFTGIANPYPLQEYLSTRCRELITIEYKDHHRYTENDLKKILDQYDNIIGKDKVIFTTEKDAMRLNREEFKPLLEGIPMYYIPIEVAFHNCDEARFDKLVQNYVSKNSGSSKVRKGKH